MAENKKAQEFQYDIKIGAKVNSSLKKSIETAEKMAKGLRDKFKTMAANIGQNAISGAVNFAKTWASEYSSAVANMKRNTGALGKSFLPIEKSFQNVMRRLPQGTGEIAQAVGDASTLLKYEGKELESTIVKFGKLAHITGKSMSDIVLNASIVQKRWNLSQSELMKFTDLAYKSVLSTGLSFEQLTNTIGRNSEALRRLGLNQEQGVYLMSNLQNAGIDVNRFFLALNKNTEISAEDFKLWAIAIQDAATEEDALKIATDAFGKESAPEMVKAIRAGTLELAAMQKQMDADKTTIEKMSFETMSWDDSVQMLGNNFRAFLLPALQKINKVVQDAAQWWASDNGAAMIKQLMSFSELLLKLAKANFTNSPLAALMRIKEKGLIEGTKANLENLKGSVSGLLGADELPKKAAGGWVSSPSIAGEAGPEAIISMNPAHRAENLRTWAEAGQALGVNGLVVNVNGLSFSPSITQNGGGTGNILDELRAQSREFAALVAGAIQSNIQRSF